MAVGTGPAVLSGMNEKIVVLRSGNLMIEGAKAHKVYFKYTLAGILAAVGTSIDGVAIEKES